MYSKFESIDSEKRERIINASMNEFAKKGYDNASTNEIVKNAQISKGILFHYFGNKKQLYLYIYQYTIDLFMKEYYEKINLEETDFLNRLVQVSNYKMNIVRRYPDITRYFEVAYMEESQELKEEIEKINSSIRLETMNVIFKNIDKSKFIDDISADKIINIIICFFDGYNQQIIKKSKMTGVPIDYDEAFKESNEYLKIFKDRFYKKS
jgi:TetR/AcrR family transcriptional regulator